MEFKETGRIQKGMTDYRHLNVTGRLEGSKFIIPEHVNGPAERTPSGRFRREDDTFSVMTMASLPYGRPGVNFINILHSTLP